MNILLLLYLIQIAYLFVAGREEPIPAYLSKIHALREAINERKAGTTTTTTTLAPEIDDDGFLSIPLKSGPKKTKKYKCILVDDDDSGEEIFVERTGTTLTTLQMKSTTAPSFAKEIQEQIALETTQNIDANLDYETTTTSTPVPLIKTSMIKPLKQILLPRAQGIPLKKLLPKQQSQFLDGQQKNEIVETVVEQQQQTQQPIQTPSTQNIPRDAKNRPLILSPDHCKMIMHYATMYQVKDVKAWVHKNCAFAKMYLPEATCDEIDILVNSCF